MMKWLILSFSFIGVFYLGLFGNSKFINKYWFPKEIRQYISPGKFSQGRCISSTHWGVNPKKVIAYKELKNNSVYLLQDQDRYEHYQYLSKYEVERTAKLSNCRK